MEKHMDVIRKAIEDKAPSLKVMSTVAAYDSKYCLNSNEPCLSRLLKPGSSAEPTEPTLSCVETTLTSGLSRRFRTSTRLWNSCSGSWERLRPLISSSSSPGPASNMTSRSRPTLSSSTVRSVLGSERASQSQLSSLSVRPVRRRQTLRQNIRSRNRTKE